MCGRYEIASNPKSWSDVYGLLAVEAAPPAPERRAEIRPTNRVPIVTTGAPHEMSSAEWWLHGAWESSGKKLALFNARDDKLEGRFWRKMAETQRCLIPASAFFEWRKVGAKTKQRVRFALRDADLFCMAGLWNRWDGQLSCTIVTTGPNDLTRPVHDRMPVILPRDAWREWIDGPKALDELKPLLVPYDASAMTAEDVVEPGVPTQ